MSSGKQPSLQTFQLRRPTLLFLLFLLAAALVYWNRVGFGLRIDDEGYIVSLARRLQHGEVPYRDFTTFYTPGIYLLLAGFFHLLGPSLMISRGLTMAVKLLNLTLAYLISRKLTSNRWALFAPLMLFLYDLSFGTGLIPYAGWFAESFILAAWLFLIFYGEENHSIWVWAAGLCCGVAFIFKQFPALAAALGVIFWLGLQINGFREPGSRWAMLRSIPALVYSLVLLLFLVLFGLSRRPAGVIFVLPAALMLAFCRRDLRPDWRPGSARSLCGFSLAAVAGALAASIPTVWQLGSTSTLRAFFWLPAKQAVTRFGFSTLVLDFRGASRLMVVFVCCLLFSFYLLLRKERRSRDRPRIGGASQPLLGLILCSCLWLSLYPWPLSTRAQWVASPFFILMLWVVWEGSRILQPTTDLRGAGSGGAGSSGGGSSGGRTSFRVLALIFLVGTQTLGGHAVERIRQAAGVLAARTIGAGRGWMKADLSAAPVWLAPSDGQGRDILGLVHHVRQMTSPGEPIFVFPRGGVFYFLSDRPNPTPYANLSVVSMTEAVQDSIIRRIAKEGVKVAIWVDRDRAEVRQPDHIAAALRRNFKPVERRGRIEIWRRR